MKNLILSFIFTSLFLTTAEKSFANPVASDKDHKFMVSGVSDIYDQNCTKASERMFENAQKQCSEIQGVARPVGRIRPILTYEGSCILLADFDCNG